MISGNRRVQTLLLIVSLLASAGSGAQTPVAQTIAALKKAPPQTEPFAEFRYSKFSKRALRSSGELRFLGADHLERVVSAPRPETSRIGQGQVSIERPGQKPRSFALSRVPELAGLLAGFSGLLAGDVEALQARFTLALEATASGFRIRMTPTEARMQKRLSEIVVFGAHARIDCLQFIEPDREQSIVYLGALAAREVAANDSVEQMLARCLAPRPE